MRKLAATAFVALALDGCGSTSTESVRSLCAKWELPAAQAQVGSQQQIESGLTTACVDEARARGFGAQVSPGQVAHLRQVLAQAGAVPSG